MTNADLRTQKAIAEYEAKKDEQAKAAEQATAESPAKKARKNSAAKAVMSLAWKLYHECTGDHVAKLRYAARRAWVIYKASGMNGIMEEIERIESYKRCVEKAACVCCFATYVDTDARVMLFKSDGSPYEQTIAEPEEDPAPELVNGWNVEKLTADGAKRWTKNGHDRVYVSNANCNLEFEYYKSGNVCAAYFNGDHISNAMGCRIGAYISRSMYIDLKTGKIVFVHSSKHSYPEEVAEILKSKYYVGSESNSRKEVKAMKGTEKQIKWAEEIKAEFIERVNHFVKESRRAEAIELINAKTDAGWWIEHRDIFELCKIGKAMRFVRTGEEPEEYTSITPHVFN